MSPFTLHSLESAPDASRASLRAIGEQFGFVPNLMGVLAAAPAALQAYVELAQLFESTSPSPEEKQVVLLTVSFENGCEYCMAAHTLAAKMAGMTPETIEALRIGGPLPDGRLEALRTFTGAVVRQRAVVPDEAVRAFLAAGFKPQQILEVLVGVTQKTLSNYVNHIAETPLDEAFSGAKWSRSTAARQV